jgi:hypothetical protein
MAALFKNPEKEEIFLGRIAPILASALMAAAVATMKRIFGF